MIEYLDSTHVGLIFVGEGKRRSSVQEQDVGLAGSMTSGAIVGLQISVRGSALEWWYW